MVKFLHMLSTMTLKSGVFSLYRLLVLNMIIQNLLIKKSCENIAPGECVLLFSPECRSIAQNNNFVSKC